MAEISMNNGCTVTNVDALTDEQVAVAVENTEREDDDLRERAHTFAESDRQYLELFCEEYERRYGQIYTLP